MEFKQLDSFSSKVITSLCNNLFPSDQDLAKVNISYTDDTELVSLAVLERHILTKLKSVGPSARETAEKTYFDQEEVNRSTSERLLKIYTGTSPDVLVVAQDIIAKLLGPLNGDVIRLMLDECYFGPGSNVGTKGFDRTSLSDKVSTKLTVTKELAPYARAIVSDDPLLSRCTVRADGPCSVLEVPVQITEAKLAFVPKNSKTDRSISVEPMLNSYVQNGIGKYLRDRLRSLGAIDLYDQSINQRAAQRAWSEDLATIDLSNASNSLSIGLVKLMLSRSHGWFKLLDLVRSPRYLYKGTTYEYQMFSGMGNGFTFPLESLIFYALAKSTLLSQGITEEPYIYGDDIILKRDVAPVFVPLLETLGMRVNRDKSYFTGLFFESCGSYYHRGRSVKPPFLREPITNLSSAIRFHNRIVAWATRDGQTFDSRVIPALRIIREKYPFTWVHPDLGDVGYHPYKDLGSLGALVPYKCLLPKNPKLRYYGVNGYWSCLYEALKRAGTEAEPSLGFFSRRQLDVSFRRSTVVYHSYKFNFLIV